MVVIGYGAFITWARLCTPSLRWKLASKRPPFSRNDLLCTEDVRILSALHEFSVCRSYSRQVIIQHLDPFLAFLYYRSAKFIR